jgi:hypothetical protein
MQSSGASLYAFYLSQGDRTIGIVDLNNHRLAPFVETSLDVVIKCVVTTRWTLEQHISSFKPDKTVLFLRDPYDVYRSLSNKVYANKSGSIQDKFRVLENTFLGKDKFDEVVYFEDFVAQNKGYNFHRSPEEVRTFNNSNSDWCRENPAKSGPEGGWGFGKLKPGCVRDTTVDDSRRDEVISATIEAWCPLLSQNYRVRVS